MPDRTEPGILVGPRDEDIVSKLDEAPGRPEYARELCEVFRVAIEASGVDVFEVGGLMLHEPLPEKRSWLRNGFRVPAAEAADLYVETVGRGYSPLFALESEVLRIELSWDGWVFLPATQEVWDAVEDLPEEQLEIGWRPGGLDGWDSDGLVEAVADEEFWSVVRAAARSRTTLLSEQWAGGGCGSRWFLVTPDNVDEVIAAMEPGSLVSVAVDPDLRVRLLDKGFTAFTAPLAPGELVYREVPFGVDDDAELAEVYAVVPGLDGVVRPRWDDPKQFL